MVSTRPWIRRFSNCLRILTALTLLLAVLPTVWGDEALASGVENPVPAATAAAAGRLVLPNWFLSGRAMGVARASLPAAAHPRPLFDGELVDGIVVRDAPGGGGTQVLTYTLTADQSLVLWAAGYFSGTYVADQTVNWSVTGGIGSVMPASGISTTFYANTVGTGTIVATHPVTGTLTDATGTVTVTAGVLHHFAVNAPASGTAGVGFATSITAQDADNNAVTSFASDVTLSTNGSDIQPTTALGSAFSNGVWNGSVTLTVAGSRTVTATFGSITGADSLTLNPNTATQLIYTSAPASTVAGVESSVFTVQRRDAYNNPVTAGAATVNLSTSSSGANAQFRATSGGGGVSSVPINNGSSSANFYYYDELAGSYTLTASVSGLPAAPTPFTVDPGSATTFAFSTVPNQTAGTTGQIASLTAQDDYGNTDPDYDGNHTLNWSGLGSIGAFQPIYPANPVNFSDGVATYLNFTPYRAETGVSLTASETAGPSGTSNTFNVSHAPATYFSFSSIPDQTAGAAGNIASLTARDQYGNVATSYAGNRNLNWSGLSLSPNNDPPQYPTNPTNFASGVAQNLSFTPFAAEQNVRLSVNQSGGPSGNSNYFDVDPADATTFDFSTIAQQTAGLQSPDFSLTAFDAYGNLDTGYTGYHFLDWGGLDASPDGTPPGYPDNWVAFIGGQATHLRFTPYDAASSVTLTTTASDGPSGASNTFAVVHALPSTFVFSAISDQEAGSPGVIDTLRAEDDYGNLATSYNGNRTLNWGGLSNSPNGDPPQYPTNPVSFASGVASALAFTPYRVQSDVQLTAVQGGVSGASNTFDVHVGATVGEMVIESAAGGAGSEVTTHDMVVYEGFTVYAAGYDAWGNYIADQVVSWSGTGVALGRLSPTNGSSTTLTPITSGTGTIRAQYSAAITDVTGLITVRTPVLEVTLSDSVASVEAGETLTYTIFYRNTGNASATSASLTLNLDNNLSYVSASPLPTSGSGRVRTWNLGTIGAGYSSQIIVTARVISPLNNGTVLESVASLDSYQTDVVTDSETTPVTSRPVLHIAKSDQPDPVQAGGTIVYTIEFSNTGNMIATGVVITDYIPANTVFDSASGNYDLEGNVITWTVGSLSPGIEPYRTLAVRVNSPLPSGTVITNTDYQIDSLQTTPITGPDVTTAVLSPTLVVTQTGDPDPVEVGSVVTFTVVYSNTGGGVATQVVITNTVPEHAVFAWASGSYAFANDQVVWNVGTLPGHHGGVRTVAFTVTSPLTDSTAIVNQVSIGSAEAEPADYVDLVYVHSSPQLHLTKMAQPDPVEAGSQLIYTLFYTNTGNANATGVVITDVLSLETIFLDASDGGIHHNGVVTWQLGLLPGEGGAGSVILTVTVDSPLTSGTTLKNTAAITCSEGCNVQASEETFVTSSPELHIEVADNPDPVGGEATLVYTVLYSNTGNANATGVLLTASYDSRLTFASARPAPSSGNNTWNLPLLPGEGGAGTVVVTLTTGTLAPEAVLNSTFTLDSTQTDPVNQVESTEAAAIDLRLSASYDDNIPYPNKQIAYTLQYTNAGDIRAEGVALTATLPAGTTYVGYGWTAVGGGVYRRAVGNLSAGANGSVQFVVQVNSTTDGRLPPGVASINPSFIIADNGGNGPEYYTANNETNGLVGIPDLVVSEIQVTPTMPEPNEPITFTVVIRNRGTGWAWNPTNKTGFYVDLFIDPSPVPASYPWNGYAAIFEQTTGLAPGATRQIVFVLSNGLAGPQHDVYAKVDNWRDPDLPLWQQNSLVPESNEYNNVTHIEVRIGGTYVYLPIVLRNH